MKGKHYTFIFSISIIFVIILVCIFMPDGGELNFIQGWQYEKGISVVDYTKAAKKYEEAANQGHAGAQRRLAFLFEEGRGVQKDIAKALHWYRMAADSGDVYSAAKVGLLLSDEEDKGDNYFEADEWLNIAINHGGGNLAQERRDYIERKMEPTSIMRARKLAAEFKAKVK